MESRRSVQFVSVYVIYCSRLTERPRRRAARTGRSSGGGTDDDGGAGATQPSPWAGGGSVAPGRCWLPSPRAGGSAGLCCLACRRPGPVPAAVATGWQRCRHGPPGRRRRAKRLTNERCAVPRHAVSKGGRSAAGAAAGAPCNRNKVYTGFAHECAVRRKCWHKVYTGDAKASEKFAHGATRSRKSLHNRSKH